MIYGKLGTNILTKLIFPRKYYIAFFNPGRPIFSIASTLLGSMIVPYLETMNPISLLSRTKKNDLFGFKEIPYFLHFQKHVSKIENDCVFS